MATLVVATEEKDGVGVPDFERPEVEHTLVLRYLSVYSSIFVSLYGFRRKGETQPLSYPMLAVNFPAKSAVTR